MAQLTISRRRLVLLGVAMAACLAALMLAAPPADAFPSVGSMVDTAVKKIFGVQGDWLTGTFLQWLIKIPDVGLTSNGGPAEVYDVTRSIAFALLGAVLTLSSINYLASGMTSQGGGAGVALESALRTGGAALMILAWPYLVDNGITLAHIASDVIVPGDKLGDVTKLFLAGVTIGAVFGNGIPVIIAIVVTIAFAVIILIIFTTKVMLGASLMVIASGMPLALAVWPIPALSWLTTGLMRWCVGIVSVQLAWAVEFGLYARVPEDFFHWSGAGAFVDKLIAPLTMLALLMLMLSTARTMLRLAGLNTSGGRMISTTASLMVSRFGMSAVSRHVPDRFGGTQGLVAERATRAKAETEKREMRESGKNGGGKSNKNGSNAGGNGSGGANTPGPKPGSSGSQSGGQGSPTRQGSQNTKNGQAGEAPPPTRTGRDGIPTRPGHQEAQREARERMQRLRQSGNQRGPGDVARALDTMQSEGLDAGAVANHIGTQGASDGSVMSRMADAELASGLSMEAAAAFRTIGVAEPSARAAGVSLWQARQTSSATSASGGSSPGGGAGATGTPPTIGTGGPRPARDSAPTNGGPGSGGGSSSPAGDVAGLGNGGAGGGGAFGNGGSSSGGGGAGSGLGSPSGGGGTSGNGGPRPASSSPPKPRRATRPAGPPPERPASPPPAQPPTPPPAQPPAPTAP